MSTLPNWFVMLVFYGFGAVVTIYLTKWVIQGFHALVDAINGAPGDVKLRRMIFASSVITDEEDPDEDGDGEIEGDTEGVTIRVSKLKNDSGQDIAEYAIMLAVILVIVVGTIRLIGSNANTVFSQVSSSLTQGSGQTQ